MKIAVIINPISGVKAKETLEREVAQRLSLRHSVAIFFTKAPYHATELARQALKDNADIIAVAGGDGTINEVAQVVINSKAALGIIPTGSGNGLARHLKIPLHFSKALDLLQKGHSRVIDTVQINDRFYIGVAGVGFDAEVGWTFALAGRRGFLSYFLSTLKNFPRYRCQKYELMIDGKNIDVWAFLMAFANSSQFGNGATIAPLAKIDDGILDLVIVKPFPLYAAPSLLIRLFTRSLHRSYYVETIPCKTILLPQRHLKAHIDGEPILFEDGIRIEIVPSSLKVIAP
ncbi:MAG TPA: diacylglycerol kinase family protein [Rhabdochlamydiaceae bacterium]|jgi:YegS/Rv2252/BmrU family lipid kinase